MADFQFDIGDKIGEFEVVSRSENSLNGELQYTVISKAHADERRKLEAEQAEADALAAGEPLPEPTPEVQPQAETPETLLPR